MKNNKVILLLLLFGLLSSLTGTTQIKLPGLIREGMVIQRDSEVKIWGWASPDEPITVSFKGRRYNTTTDSEGKWQVLLAPSKAGGPYSILITGENTIELKDILVGDVWLCSGQSNMVHYLDVHKERYEKEIQEANYPKIRQFLVPTHTNLQEMENDLPDGSWVSANPESVKRFSVVGYFFAKKLYDQYHIPIGFINASVGGTPIEAWTSEEGLKLFPDIQETIEKNKDTSYIHKIELEAKLYNEKKSKEKETDRGLIGDPKWFETTYTPTNWKNINIPGYWEDQGIKDLNGVVWYRKEINVPSSMTGIPAKISLGRIVDADFVYINGQLIGNTSYQYPQRRYDIDAGVLKPGKNTVVIRVINYNRKGGFVPDKPYYLKAGDQSIDLKGYWQYRVGKVFPKNDHGVRGISYQNQPTALFNGMIAPLKNYNIKGIVWYQGESNTGKPEQYKKLLPALIGDWRGLWENDGLPFLYAQLPNFMEVDYLPSESNWALFREAQLETLKVPNTGMAVTIDLGEWNDIHPDNKKPVGDRLALAALKVAYGEKKITWSGPMLKSAISKENKIILTFDHAESGLVSGNGEDLAHFAIAGADKNFQWGIAQITGTNRVTVWNDDIPNPIYIRYAWADNPDFANLYNKEGLPASPFQVRIPNAGD